MAEHDRLLTVAAAAEFLGCHPETLRRAIRARRLPCYRFGGCTRISSGQLRAYLEDALCPVRDRKDPSSSGTEPNGQSSGGKTDRVAEFQQARRMNAALDNPSRISKPNLNVIRSS